MIRRAYLKSVSLLLEGLILPETLYFRTPGVTTLEYCVDKAIRDEFDEELLLSAQSEKLVIHFRKGITLDEAYQERLSKVLRDLGVILPTVLDFSYLNSVYAYPLTSKERDYIQSHPSPMLEGLTLAKEWSLKSAETAARGSMLFLVPDYGFSGYEVQVQTSVPTDLENYEYMCHQLDTMMTTRLLGSGIRRMLN